MRGKSRFRQTKFIKPRNRNRRQVESIIAQRYRNVQKQEREQQQKKEEDFDCEAKINRKTPLKELLRSWTNCHGISTKAVNDLLRILIASGSANVNQCSWKS